MKENCELLYQILGLTVNYLVFFFALLFNLNVYDLSFLSEDPRELLIESLA